MNTQDFIKDIPRDLAYRAHSGTSHVPEKRAQMERDDYAATLAADYKMLLTHAPTDEKRATLETEFARYREGYKSRSLAYLHSRSRCMSSMIAGPSNFPVQRMEKRNAVCHRRLTELCEFRKRALEAIKKTLHPEWRPIMAGDADAVSRLRKKIEEEEKSHAAMKAVNLAIRKNKKHGEAAQIAAIRAVHPMFTEAKAAELIKPDVMGCIGFAPYAFQNSGANLRRMRARLAVLERNKAAPQTSKEGSNGVRLEDCPNENRVRLFFPGKPDETIRTRLKSGGFRWTPSLGCWQAYRNFRSMEQAKEFITTPKETPNTNPSWHF
jgi:hypothetical protein